MKDTVIKNTGNSRFLKSGISASTTWEQFRSMLIAGSLPIDLNGLNASGIQQQGTLLNTANFLPASLCSVLGLTAETAVPADAFSTLSNFSNWYWWEKYNYAAESYTQTQLAPVTSYDEDAPFLFMFRASETKTITFSVANSYTTQDDSAVLVDPSDVTLTMTAASIIAELEALKGKYIKYKSNTGSWGPSAEIKGAQVLFVPSTVVFGTAVGGSGAGYYIITNSVGLTKISGASAEYNSKSGGVVGTEARPVQTAFPENGKQGNYWYTRRGTIGPLPQIAHGTYTGTGTYGDTSRNTLTFPFSPKLVAVQGGDGETCLFIKGSSYASGSAPGTYGYRCCFSISNRTIEWDGGSAKFQLNQEGELYGYVAIG